MKIRLSPTFLALFCTDHSKLFRLCGPDVTGMEAKAKRLVAQ